MMMMMMITLISNYTTASEMSRSFVFAHADHIATPPLRGGPVLPSWLLLPCLAYLPCARRTISPTHTSVVQMIVSAESRSTYMRKNVSMDK